MRVLFVVIVAGTVAGTVLLGSMFARDNRDLGMAGLAVLITADVMAMVYAAMDQ